jgi:hypothetical protein
MSIKAQKLEKKTLSKEQVAKALCKEIYISAVHRVVELAEKMNPPPDQTTIKRMIQKRFAVAVEATEIFLDGWQSIGKGRFLPKED